MSASVKVIKVTMETITPTYPEEKRKLNCMSDDFVQLQTKYNKVTHNEYYTSMLYPSFMLFFLDRHNKENTLLLSFHIILAI